MSADFDVPPECQCLQHTAMRELKAEIDEAQTRIWTQERKITELNRNRDVLLLSAQKLSAMATESQALVKRQAAEILALNEQIRQEHEEHRHFAGCKGPEEFKPGVCVCGGVFP